MKQIDVMADAPEAPRRPSSLRALTALLVGVLSLVLSLMLVPSAQAATSYVVTDKGDKSANVLTVQHLLNARGISTGTDGLFGDGTESRVRSFQSRSGLAIDGVVGPNTWSRLVVTVNEGTGGRSAVKAVQTQLNKYGYQLAVDGDFGSRTVAAVRSFQRKRGLSIDGSVGPNTWRVLVGYSQVGDQVACYYKGGTTSTSLRSAQVSNVRQILSAGDAVGAARNAKIITLMTAIQESRLCNVPQEISDRDSMGLFQQRPSTGWCYDTNGCANGYQSTLGFLGRSSYTSNLGLLDFDYWNYTKTRAADRVQRSCCSEAYAKWEPMATSLVNTYD